MSDFEYDVFRSHASADKAAVRKLAQRLKGDGVRVWFDEWVIQPGDHWPSKIEQGLESSRTLVLVMSQAAFASEWVTLERHTALFRDPTNQQRRFIPLRLDDCDIKDSLKQFAYVDWREKSEPEYARLVAYCRSEAVATSRNSVSPGDVLQQKSQGNRGIANLVRVGVVMLMVALGVSLLFAAKHFADVFRTNDGDPKRDGDYEVKREHSKEGGSSDSAETHPTGVQGTEHPDGVSKIRTESHRDVEIVFVVDGTYSMEQWMPLVEQTVRVALESSPEHCKVAICWFGDSRPGEKEVETMKLTDAKKDFEQILELVRKRTPAGGGDPPEPLYQGIIQSAADAGFSSNSRKMLFVIGDAGDREEQLELQTQVATQLTPDDGSPAELYAIHVGRQGGTQQPYSREFEQQMNEIAMLCMRRSREFKFSYLTASSENVSDFVKEVLTSD